MSTKFANITPPPPGIDLTASQFCPTTAAPQAANIGAPGADEILDKLEDIESNAHKQMQGHMTLQQAVAKLRAEHDQHTTSTRNVFGQVTQLLATTSSLHEKFQSFEGQVYMSVQKDMASHKEEWLEAARVQNKEFEDQVRKLLSNFKTEIVSVSRESEARHAQTTKTMEMMCEKLSRNMETQETMRKDHERLMTILDDVKEASATQYEAAKRQIDHTLTETRDLNDHFKEIKDEIARLHENQQNALDLSREETIRKAAEVQEYCETLITNSLEGFSSDLDEKLLKDNNDLESSIKQVDSVVDELSRRQVEDRTASNVKFADLLKLNGKLESQIQTVQHGHKELQMAFDSKIAASLNEIRAAAADQSEKIHEMDRFMNATETTVKLAIGNFNEERTAMQRMSSTLAEQLETTEHMVKNKLTAFTQSEKEFVKEQVSRVEQDLDRKHRKLIETTHQAMQDVIRDTDTAPHIAELRVEMQKIREEHASTHTTLESLRLDGGLESAFAEVKDWLQDVERRMVTRASVDEQLLSFSSQLSSLKHSTQQAETVLAQRIDAEKAAREHDHAQAMNNLQKLQVMHR